MAVQYKADKMACGSAEKADPNLLISIHFSILVFCGTKKAELVP